MFIPRSDSKSHVKGRYSLTEYLNFPKELCPPDGGGGHITIAFLPSGIRHRFRSF